MLPAALLLSSPVVSLPCAACNSIHLFRILGPSCPLCIHCDLCGLQMIVTRSDHKAHKEARRTQGKYCEIDILNFQLQYPDILISSSPDHSLLITHST
jgi:hypothetical protein